MSFSEDELNKANYCYDNASEDTQREIEAEADENGMDVIDYIAMKLKKTNFAFRDYG
ncbi:MAG: hypothetical protein MJK13_14525 [Pseudomonadales bacterium]|nr:hypothetical protein [Pseudomonadales bacterium]